MSLPEGPLHRAPRPLIGWGGVILVVFCLLFLSAVSAIALFALWRWANGQPVDLTGFAALMGAAVPAGAAIWSLVKQFIVTRSDERMTSIALGQSAPPFVPSPPLGPSPDGPRPGDST